MTSAAITPRLLTDKQAADYCSLPLRTFIKLGIGRVRLGAKVRFDKIALDIHLSRLSGVEAPAEVAPADDDPEAAIRRFMSTRANASSPRP